jgi:hypothetical protein
MSPRSRASLIVFLFAGILAFGFGPAVLRGWMSGHWPSAQGVIDSSRLEEMMHSGGHPDWRVYLGYHFLVDDVRYEGTRFTSTGEFYGDEVNARAVVAENRPGQVVQIFYDPRDPSNAVLRPGLDSRQYFVFFSFLVVFAIGIGIVFGFFRAQSAPEQGPRPLPRQF